MPPREREKIHAISWLLEEGEEESVIIDFTRIGIAARWELSPLAPSKGARYWVEEIRREIRGSTCAVLQAMGEHDRAELERSEVATANIIDKLEEDNKDMVERLDRISEQNRALRREILLSRPYVGWLRASLAALAVFAISLLVWFWRGVVVVSPTVSLIGAVLSTGFVIMSLLFKKDWPHMIEEDSQ